MVFLVKRIAFLTIVCLLSPVLANEPGQVAMDFLKKVREGEVDLKPGEDTAIQKQTTDAKLETIRKRLELLADELGEGSLELGEIRQDDGFAAVMVRQIGGFDDSGIQVFPVALVLQGDLWRPAPVLASFENAVSGYSVSLRRRLAALESWMMRERVVELEKLVSRSAERARERIRNSIVGEDLEGDDLEKIMAAFLEACAKRNQAAVLGYLGGLGDPLPENWKQRLNASQAAVSKDAALEYPWRLIVSEDVVRVPVLLERTANDGMVSLACLDPARAANHGTMEKILLFHFEFEKDRQGRWRIELPDSLLKDDPELLDENEGLDVDLLDRFPAELRERRPLVTERSAEQALEEVLRGLKSGELSELLGRVDFNGKPKEARIACFEAAADWWSLNEPGTLRSPVRLGFKKEGMLAVAAFQWFSMNQPDHFQQKSLFFKNTGDGWVWTSGVVSPADRESHGILSKWLKENEPEWRLSWRKTLLEPSVRLDGVPLDRQAGDPKVEALIKGWLEALEERDLEETLGYTAWLGGGDEIPMKGLRNLSYELSSAGEQESRLTGIHRSGPWVAAAITHIREDQTKHSFMPVLLTEDGPRLIPEIDLIAGTDRTRKFLNAASFDRLGDFLQGDELEPLKALFSGFEKSLKGD